MESRRRLLAIREHLRALLDLPKGCASGEIERFIMMIAARTLASMSEEEIHALPARPSWLTEDNVKASMLDIGGPVHTDAGAAAPPSTASASTAGDIKIRNRAIDQYIRAHRERLRAACVKKKTNAKRLIYRTAAKEYDALPRDQKLTYISCARSAAGAASRKRKDDGRFASTSSTVGIDGCILGDLTSGDKPPPKKKKNIGSKGEGFFDFDGRAV